MAEALPDPQKPADAKAGDSKPADARPVSPLSALSGDAGCVVLGIPLAAAGASAYIFEASVKAGSPWAGAAATTALAMMGLGVVWVLARSRG